MAGWHEPFPILESAVDPLTTISGVVDDLRTLRLPEQVQKKGVLLLERRWVVGELPKHELLNVLAHCYGVLAQLVVDAHRQCGVVMRTFRADSHSPKPVRTEHLSGRLPCMVASEDMRTAILHLGIGKFISLSHVAVPVEPRDAEKAAARYGGEGGELGLRAGETTVDASARWFEHAKKVLAKDGFHGPMMVIAMADGHTQLHQVADHDRQTLYLSMSRIASHVERTGAVGVLNIAEFWHGRMADLKPGQRVADLPNRKELLQVYAASLDGRRRVHAVAFSKNADGKVEFGDSTVEEGGSEWGYL